MLRENEREILAMWIERGVAITMYIGCRSVFLLSSARETVRRRVINEDETEINNSSSSINIRADHTHTLIFSLLIHVL